MFKQFPGRCALAGKMIAVYHDGEGYSLRAETTAGNPVRYSYRDEDGKRQWATCHELYFPNNKTYEQFVESVTGNQSTQDARIVQRTLIKMGYPEDQF